MASGMELVRPRVSYADLQRAPEDGRRYELYEGEVFVVPAPIPRHQRIVQRISDLLLDYEQQHGGRVFVSPIDIVFSEYNVLQPDVVFFERSRAPLLDLDVPIRVPPDLVVEVLSPATASTDRGKKMQMFARYGVRECWLVDPHARSIEIFALREDAYALVRKASEGDRDVASSTVLPELQFPAGQIFLD